MSISIGIFYLKTKYLNRWLQFFYLKVNDDDFFKSDNEFFKS